MFGFTGDGVMAEIDIAPCLATKLVPASSFFKRELDVFIDTLRTIENTNTSYDKALQRVSQYLNYTDGRSRLSEYTCIYPVEADHLISTDRAKQYTRIQTLLMCFRHRIRH